MPLSFEQLRAKAQGKKDNVIEWSEALDGKGTIDGGLEERHCYLVWTNEKQFDLWGVCFLKHGNEYFRENDGDFTFDGGQTIVHSNKQDMKPMLWHKGHFVEHDASFKHIFRFFDFVYNGEHRDTLKTIGCLLLRDCFYLEHQHVESLFWSQNAKMEWVAASTHGYSFQPSSDLIKQITSKVPSFTIDNIEIDTEAYLHYIDGIAQNESVKYHHKICPYSDSNEVYDAVIEAAGRENCLRTLVKYIYCLFNGLSSQCAEIRREAGTKPHPIAEDACLTFFSLEVGQ